MSILLLNSEHLRSPQDISIDTMSSKLKLSQIATQQLDALSKALGLRRNIVCRIAIGMSLNIPEPPQGESDVSGQEFNQSTIVGTDEPIFTAMIANQYGMRIDPDKFFSTYIRLEIVRGLDLMTKKYTTLNSPTEFMKCIASD